MNVAVETQAKRVDQKIATAAAEEEQTAAKEKTDDDRAAVGEEARKAKLPSHIELAHTLERPKRISIHSGKVLRCA